MRRGQRARSGNWRAGCLETSTSGSEEGGWKRAARAVPRQPPILLGSSVRENHCKSERAYLLWLQKTYSSGTMRRREPMLALPPEPQPIFLKEQPMVILPRLKRLVGP